jgi:hypothetical protein
VLLASVLRWKPTIITRPMLTRPVSFQVSVRPCQGGRGEGMQPGGRQVSCVGRAAVQAGGEVWGVLARLLGQTRRLSSTTAIPCDACMSQLLAGMAGPTSTMCISHSSLLHILHCTHAA